MEILYASGNLQKELETEKKLLRRHGPKRAKLIQQRLFELRAALCLEDLRYLPGPRLHQLVRKPGQPKAVFSVDLDHPMRLLFEAAEEPEPALPGGGVDWRRVVAIRILEVSDTHDPKYK